MSAHLALRPDTTSQAAVGSPPLPLLSYLIPRVSGFSLYLGLSIPIDQGPPQHPRCVLYLPVLGQGLSTQPAQKGEGCGMKPNPL